MKRSRVCRTSFQSCLLLLVAVLSARGQEPIVETDSASFHSRYDSLLSKSMSLTDGQDQSIRVQYYFRWISDYSSRVSERFGVLTFKGDSVYETFVLAPYSVGGPFEDTKLVTSAALRRAVFRIDPRTVTSLMRLTSSKRYLIQPTNVNGRLYFPMNAIRLFIIKNGNSDKMAFSKHGKRNLSDKIENGQDLAFFMNWLFDFESPHENGYVRIRGTR